MAPDDEDLEPSRLDAAAEIVETIRRIERLSVANDGRRSRGIDRVALNALLVGAIVVLCVASLIASYFG